MIYFIYILLNFFIFTMKKNKQYLWLPYLNKISMKKKNVIFSYKGGNLKIDWDQIHSIMLYGDHIPLTQEFLEKTIYFNIPIVIHRRNLNKTVWIISSFNKDPNDLLTKQIKHRDNEKKKLYIARVLLKAKFKTMSWLIPYDNFDLSKARNIKELRNVEAIHSKVYWRDFFSLLNLNTKRRSKNNVSNVINAVSKFITTVLLRWIHYHKLSPYHGFLHEPTDYPALVYDFFEPYRGLFDKVIFNYIRNDCNNNIENVKVAHAIMKIKDFLYTKVYTHQTRQIVTVHELLHGIVLAFRAYLLEDAYRFIIPLPGKKIGGRPIKAGYKLYGRTAGKTDFWEQAEKITKATTTFLKI